ncbi:hypothetical protein V8G54_012977 [Vigna mungo]|uniref:Uncharacterized protein n=1 Tax=Vigna mungo TaxID=3915 RepID=A0AAQ3NUT1_VIGMU
MAPKVKQQGHQMFLKFRSSKDQQRYTRQSITWKKMQSKGSRLGNKNPRTFLGKIFPKASIGVAGAENAAPLLKSVGVENSTIAGKWATIKQERVEDYIQDFEHMDILYIHKDIGILEEVGENAQRVLLESLAAVTWTESGEKFIQEFKILVSQVYGWGRGEHGRLGFGDSDKSSKMVPQKVQLLAGEDIVQVSCGGTHSVALTRDGRMFSFGRGDHGRLGYGRKVTTGQPMEVPINLPPPHNLTATEAEGHWIAKLVACGGRHTLAIVQWKNRSS